MVFRITDVGATEVVTTERRMVSRATRTRIEDGTRIEGETIGSRNLGRNQRIRNTRRNRL